ncbi:hypothetical protein SKAU_G00134840 [Synaphobranchus kaupii]|uniref:Uncharacterized protein n=1 Tax=Synaphobranchus kaupii TaxID=118154 RepID=A0A9Q1J3P4_SYNKA|nr:hypothetical protein SKAU_G00134840 [Synaphobranchus kaupii]
MSFCGCQSCGLVTAAGFFFGYGSIGISHRSWGRVSEARSRGRRLRPAHHHCPQIQTQGQEDQTPALKTPLFDSQEKVYLISHIPSNSKLKKSVFRVNIIRAVSLLAGSGCDGTIPAVWIQCWRADPDLPPNPSGPDSPLCSRRPGLPSGVTDAPHHQGPLAAAAEMRGLAQGLEGESAAPPHPPAVKRPRVLHKRRKEEIKTSSGKAWRG